MTILTACLVGLSIADCPPQYSELYLTASVEGGTVVFSLETNEEPPQPYPELEADQIAGGNISYAYLDSGSHLAFIANQNKAEKFILDYRQHLLAVSQPNYDRASSYKAYTGTVGTTYGIIFASRSADFILCNQEEQADGTCTLGCSLTCSQSTCDTSKKLYLCKYGKGERYTVFDNARMRGCAKLELGVESAG